MATPKTTKKKAAKKTYPPAKKAAPKPKWITAKELSVIMAESQARMEAREARMDARQAKTEAAIDRLSIENEKTLAAVREASIRSDKAITEIHAILDRMEDSDREASIRTDKAITEIHAMLDRMEDNNREASIRTDKAIAEIRAVTDRMEDSFGGVSKRLGDLTEIIVVPKIRVDINKLGNHNFTDAVADKTVTAVVDGIKTPVAEVDMLLSGADEAMAVEIKAHLKRTKVDNHVKRLQKLRTYEKDSGVAGKKLFGAVAGVVIDDDAREHAKENGLYVVEIREEENKLMIEKPETRRTW